MRKRDFTMSANQIPENVGKKIIEALMKKRAPKTTETPQPEEFQQDVVAEPTVDFQQTLEEVNAQVAPEEHFEPEQPVVYGEVSPKNELPTESEPVEIPEEYPEDFAQTVETTESVEEIHEEPVFENDEPAQTLETAEEPEFVENTVDEVHEEPAEPVLTEEPALTEEEPAHEQILSEEPDDEILLSDENIEIPSNVAILDKLVAGLPAGVSKQAGAQIICQTMEALGVSLKNVLAEAQQIQDVLAGEIDDCNRKIDECRAIIAQNEKNVRDCKNQAAKINSLISLFVMTEND